MIHAHKVCDHESLLMDTATCIKQLFERVWTFDQSGRELHMATRSPLHPSSYNNIGFAKHNCFKLYENNSMLKS